MSESPRKLRSPLVVYGPLVAVLVLLGIALAVLFTMGGIAAKGSEPTPSPPPATPPSEEEVRKHMGIPSRVDVQKTVEELAKKRGRSWFDLNADEQRQMQKDTHGNGRLVYETTITDLEKQGKLKPLK